MSEFTGLYAETIAPRDPFSAPQPNIAYEPLPPAVLQQEALARGLQLIVTPQGITASGERYHGRAHHDWIVTRHWDEGGRLVRADYANAEDPKMPRIFSYEWHYDDVGRLFMAAERVPNADGSEQLKEVTNYKYYNDGDNKYDEVTLYADPTVPNLDALI
jgi:hypothetical protein